MAAFCGSEVNVAENKSLRKGPGGRKGSRACSHCVWGRMLVVDG